MGIAQCIPGSVKPEDDAPILVGKPLPFAKERKLGLEAALKASECCRRVQSDLVPDADARTKKDRSPVTVADYASQAILVADLSAAFPEYDFVAEESATQLREDASLRGKVLDAVRVFIPDIDEEKLLALIDRGGAASAEKDSEKGGAEKKRWWAIDPIDGTSGFLKKGQYAVALALMEDNKPVLGFLGCPSLPFKLNDPTSPIGCVLLAVKGQGAYMQAMTEFGAEERIVASSRTALSKAVMTESPNSGHSSPHLLTINEKFGTSEESIKIDSQCKYAIVARGESDIYLRYSGLKYKECVWDHAAGVIIVEEAGGVVTDMAGKPLDFSQGRKLTANTGIACSSKAIRDAAMKVIAEVNPIKRDSKKD